jgi:metal-dependent amidase/aminoacylase/carboxypeptidase family protein
MKSPAYRSDNLQRLPDRWAHQQTVFASLLRARATHAADPHIGIDPLVVSANILLALQTIVARNLDPTKCGVVSVTALNGGQAGSAVPQTAEMIGTARAYEPKIRDLLQRRVTEIAENVARPPSLLPPRSFPPLVSTLDAGAAVAFTSEQNAVRYLPAHRIC